MTVKPETTTVPEGTMPVLLFTIAGETWGMAYRDIQEIMISQDITPFPKAPSFIAGIMRKRGAFITVVDLDHVAEAPERMDKGEKKIISLKHDDMNIGVLVNSRLTAAFIPENVVSRGAAQPERLTEQRGAVKTGVVDYQGRNIHLLAAGEVFSFLERSF